MQQKLTRGNRETWKPWSNDKVEQYDTLQDRLFMSLESARRTSERDLEYTQQCQRCKFGGYSWQENGCEKKHIQKMSGQVQAKQ